MYIRITTEIKCRKEDNNKAFFFPSNTGIDFSLFSLSNSSSCKAYIISKPLTQNKTTNDKRTGVGANLPVTERYAPIGARAKPSPKIKWQSDVNRFV